MGTGVLGPAHRLEDPMLVALEVANHQVELGARHPKDGHPVSLEMVPEPALDVTTCPPYQVPSTKYQVLT